MIVWNEPYEGEFGLENVSRSRTEDEAIASSVAASIRAKGYNVYADMEDGEARALEDFITVHWAWQE